jgi:3-methyladenine DNA glycosylase/8-oxoguanine DNA glycosylase
VREHLALTPPVDLDATLERYERFGPDPANRLERDAAGAPALIRCVADARGAPIAVHVRQAGDGVDVESDRPLDDAGRHALRTALGDVWDLEALAALAAERPTVAEALGGVRYRPPLTVDAFEALVTSITTQQISLRAAFAIRGRIVERYGAAVAFARAFPTPAAIAASRPDEVRSCGLTVRKAASLHNLATLIATGELDVAGLAALSDDDVIATICAVPGLGRWTADWFLLRTLGRPDALPAGDLGVRRVLGAADEAAARAAAEPFRPLRGLVTLHLLRAYT